MADLDKMLTGFGARKTLQKNEIFVHFHSNLELLTGFQKLCDPVWICHCEDRNNAVESMLNRSSDLSGRIKLAKFRLFNLFVTGA